MMSEATTPGVKRIRTLRLAVRPGASAMTQLARVLMGRERTDDRTISMAGFFMPYPVAVGGCGRNGAGAERTDRYA